MLRSLARRLFPIRVRSLIRRGRDNFLDFLDVLRGGRDPLLPPRRLIFVGGDSSNFRALGDKWLNTFIHVGGLQPEHRVLDLGCGVGRMAVPLTNFLDSRGSYEGLDIVKEGIDWCVKTITPRFPRFRFQVADVYNFQYNPKGGVEPAKYRLPFLDDDFDFTFLTSVFTHMRPPEVENYLNEVRRTLRPGGRCLITFFLLTPESLREIQERRVDPSRRFDHDIGGCRTVDPSMPEAAIAYPIEAVREMYVRCGLKVLNIHHGGWCGTPGARHGQDIILATKPAEAVGAP